MSEKKYLDLSGLGLFLDNLKKSRPVIELTSDKYTSLEQSGEIDPKAFYFITDEENVEENETHKILKTSSFNCKSLYATDKYIILLGNVTVNVKITKNGSPHTMTKGDFQGR